MALKIDNFVSDNIEDIIKRAAEEGAVIICQSNYTAEGVKKLADEMDIVIKEPVSIQWLHLYKEEYDLQGTPIIIFDQVKVLQYLLEVNAVHDSKKEGKKKGNERMHLSTLRKR